MRLLLPVPPDIGNERGHWAVRNRRRQNFFGDCDDRQLFRLLPPPPPQPFESVEITAHFRLWNEMDADNLRARLKHALDWLRTRGYIVDDRAKNVRLAAVTQEIDRKDRGLELTLEEVDHGR